MSKIRLATRNDKDIIGYSPIQRVESYTTLKYIKYIK